MARVFKLVRGAATVALDNASGIQIRSGADNWQPRWPTAEPDPPPLAETLRLKATASSADNLAGTMQAWWDMQRWAAEYREDANGTAPVWFHVKLDGETGERRSLVHRIDTAMTDSGITEAIDQEIALFDAVIERGPYWESIGTVALNSGTALYTGASVVWDYTASPGADIVGDVPGRLYALTMMQNEVGGSPSGLDIDTMWMGVRSAARHGTLANFVNIWECEDAQATPGTDATGTALVGASGGTALHIAPGTSAWAIRLGISLSAVTSNYVDNWGDYLWLLRAQVTSGVWEAKLRYCSFSSSATAAYVEGPTVEISNTDWRYAEMGVANIPGYVTDALPPVARDSASWRIEVWARRTDGSGALRIDCLCPIPVDEGILVLRDIGLVPDVPGPVMFIAGSSPRGEWTSVGYGPTGAIWHKAEVDTAGFALPPGDGRMIIAAQGTAASNIGLNLIFDSYNATYAPDSAYVPRWVNLRGGE